MRRNFGFKSAGLISVLTLFLLSFAPFARAAGSATFSLSPASGTYQTGSSFSVTLTENSGSQPINAVDITLNISPAAASKIQFSDVNAGGTKFTSLSATYTASSAHIASYVSPVGLGGPGTLSGSQKVATLNLSVKTISATTSADVTFNTSSGSIADANSNTDIWNHDASGASFTLKPKPSTTSTSPKTSPKATTKAPASSSSSSTRVTPNAVEQQSNPTAPVPASTTGNALANYIVSIKVVDNKGRAVSGATVSFDNNSSTTDSTGVAGFLNIPAGIYKVNVKSSKLQVSSNIDVDGSKPTNVVQQFEVKLKPSYTKDIIAGVAAVVVIVVIIMLILKRMRNRFRPLKSVTTDMPKVVIGGAQPPVPSAPAEPSVVKPATNPTPSQPLLKPTVISPHKTNSPDTKA